MHPDDTIAAVASAPGGAARGVVRLSGPDTRACLEKCFTPQAGSLDDATAATVISGRLRLDSAATSLPVDLYFWPTPRSYTRQVAAELHTIGSPPLLQAALRTLCAHGARLAEPGEFTLRAFLAGRLDLVQAEAVLGVIDARGERALERSLAQLAGGISTPLATLRESLLELLAHLEAGLDFADEEIEFIAPAELRAELAEAAEQLARAATQMECRDESEAGVPVVLVGWPNVGKSSLFNALLADRSAPRPAALVSAGAGTTRDYLTAPLDLDGLEVELIDTAGVEPDRPAGEIAAAAQRVTTQQRDRAALGILCLDGTRPLNAWEEEALREDDAAQLVVVTKGDAPRHLPHLAGAIGTSSRSGAGLPELRRALRAAVEGSAAGDVVAATATRCRDSLRRAAMSLATARDLADREGGEELIAAEVRAALDDLGDVVGAVYTDDILDRVFSRFCIGK